MIPDDRLWLFAGFVFSAFVAFVAAESLLNGILWSLVFVGLMSPG